MIDVSRLTRLEPEDAQLRIELIEAAVEVVKEENLEASNYSDEELVEFALEWQGRSRADTKVAKALLREGLGETIVLQWIVDNYSYKRLAAMSEFTEYCNWLNAEEIIRHFGSFLGDFKALQGEAPGWCLDTPFHTVLQVAYKYVHARLRTERIRTWLRDHWDEAVKLFEHHQGCLETFPYLQGIEYSHIYTQYKNMRWGKQAKEWVSSNPEEAKELENELREERV